MLLGQVYREISHPEEDNSMVKIDICLVDKKKSYFEFYLSCVCYFRILISCQILFLLIPDKNYAYFTYLRLKSRDFREN